MKDKDWLKGRAMKLYKKHKNNLWTSGFVIVELLLLSKRFNLDSEKIIVSVYKIVNVVGLEQTTALLAAHYIKESGLNVFDALHASFAQFDSVISSDKVYDDIGLKRIHLDLNER